MITAALFMTAKIWKQQINEWTEKTWYIYNGISFSHDKE